LILTIGASVSLAVDFGVSERDSRAKPVLRRSTPKISITYLVR
jgi:hypothetical protein